MDSAFELLCCWYIFMFWRQHETNVLSGMSINWIVMFPCSFLVNTKEVWISKIKFYQKLNILVSVNTLVFRQILLFFSHSVVFNGVIIRSILSKCLGLFWSERLTGFQSPLKFNECQATWKKHVNFLHRATQYFRFIRKVTLWIFAESKASKFPWKQPLEEANTNSNHSFISLYLHM